MTKNQKNCKKKLKYQNFPALGDQLTLFFSLKFKFFTEDMSSKVDRLQYLAVSGDLNCLYPKMKVTAEYEHLH